MEDIKLYTVEEVCKILKVSNTTVWKYAKTGKLQSVRIGRRIYFKPESLEAALRSGENIK